jgi:flagellar capping protein FliD
MNEILVILATAGGGGLFGWFFTRKKQAAEVIGNEIDNDVKVIELWKGWSEHLKDEINVMNSRIEKLTKRIEELEAENKDHLKTIENLIAKRRGKNI